jgi:hypothetical protein
MVSGKPPRRSKSPDDPVTIDLTAEETPSETVTGVANGSADPAPEANEPSAAFTLENAETASFSEQADSQSETVSETGQAAEASTSTATGELREARPAKSSPALSALVAAGIFGGLVALAGAGSMQYAGYLPAVSPAEKAPADTSALADEVAVLKTEVANLASTPAAATDPRTEERLAALEAAIANQTTAAPDTAAIEELRQRLSETTAALDALKTQIAGNASALAETETRLNARLAEAEKKIDAPRSDVEMAKAIALTALKSATERGGPYMAELDALAAIAPEEPAIEGLRPHAATGIPSRAELTRQFGGVADAILAAIHQPDPNQGIGERLLSSALSVVKVRPVGNVEGATPEAIIARMEDKLQNGDLKGATIEWEGLPETGKTVSATFVSTLKTRIEIETLVGDALAATVSGKKG